MRIEGRKAGTPARHTDGTGVNGAGRPVAPVRPTDAVHTSSAGRARARADLPAGHEHATPLTSDQIASIRDRISSGAYNSLDVIDAVARRIVAAGDLTAGPGAQE